MARQKNNPKVFMWSSVWEDGDVTTEDEEMQEEQEDNKEEKKEEIFNNITSSLEAVEEMEIAKEDVKEEEEEKKEEEEMVTENGENDSKPSDLNNSGTEIPVEAEKNKETPVISSQNENNETEQKTEMTEETKNSSIPSVPQENQSNFGSELAEYFSTEGENKETLSHIIFTFNFQVLTSPTSYLQCQRCRDSYLTSSRIFREVCQPTRASLPTFYPHQQSYQSQNVLTGTSVGST